MAQRPISGGSSVQLSHDLAPGDFAYDASYFASGERVVYRTAELTGGMFGSYGAFTGLVSAGVTGGPITVVSSAATSGQPYQYLPYGGADDVLMITGSVGHFELSVGSATNADAPVTLASSLRS